MKTAGTQKTWVTSLRSKKSAINCAPVIWVFVAPVCSFGVSDGNHTLGAGRLEQWLAYLRISAGCGCRTGKGLNSTPNRQDTHWLRPLLAPESIAYVGASVRAGSVGNNILKMAALGGYRGRLYPVNPGYDAVEELTCFPNLASLPEPPDLAVLALADQRLEQALIEAIEAGAKSALMFAGANLVEETDYKLPQRLADIGREANLPICGGNGMGFYNFDHDLLVTFSIPPYKTRAGNATLISHSGSAWSALSLNDGRLAYNLSVSSGQELTVTVADYLDYALEQPSTAVVGLLLETIRDPDGFLRGLEKANKKQIPVVALKVGRSPKSAELAISHSGAIAGDDGAYEALFDRFGVSRVQTVEELGASLALMSQGKPPGAGGLASIHDSGFERELFIDLAEDIGVRLAEISPATTHRLGELLDPGLEPINPLDAWGTGVDGERIFVECFEALMSDRDTALGFVSHNPRDNTRITEMWMTTLANTSERSDKPIALVSGFPWILHHGVVERLTARGIAIIDGMDNGLVAARNLFEQRDFLDRPRVAEPPSVDPEVIKSWCRRLTGTDTLDETDGLSLLADFGIPVAPGSRVDTLEQTLEAAERLSMPVVLKTARPGIFHKTDVDGVRLNLNGLDEVAGAYAELAARLGPVMTVAAMVTGGVEMSLGLVKDRQFGPLVMMGAGGVFVEVLGDRRLALPPFDRSYALRLMDRLKIRGMLNGYRGGPPLDVTGFADAAARLSDLAVSLGHLIAQIDVNPVIVGENDAIAVDALIIPDR